MSNQKFATNALHAGHDTTQTEVHGLFQFIKHTSYVFNNTDHAANLFSLAELGIIYTRINNPPIKFYKNDWLHLKVVLAQLFSLRVLRQFQPDY